MSYHNPLTVKRHQKALADMIVETMRNENLSLLEAYVKIASMATSDDVIGIAKERIALLNNQR